MKKIFITILRRERADDFWGFALSEDAEFLLEESDPDEHTLGLLLGLYGSETNHHIYEEKYPEGYILVYISPEAFEKDVEFKAARMRSLHSAMNASI